MNNRKTLLSKSGFNLVQVDILDGNDNAIRVSYEVVDPDEDAIGRFGSLSEAQLMANARWWMDWSYWDMPSHPKPREFSTAKKQRPSWVLRSMLEKAGHCFREFSSRSFNLPTSPLTPSLRVPTRMMQTTMGRHLSIWLLWYLSSAATVFMLCTIPALQTQHRGPCGVRVCAGCGP